MTYRTCSVIHLWTLSQILLLDFTSTGRSQWCSSSDFFSSSSSSKVLEHIRLPLISPYYLHDVIESLDVVKENQGCQRLISEAKDYLLLKDRRGELYCPRARPRRSTGEHTCTYARSYSYTLKLVCLSLIIMTY